ncbi:hypothetical protein LEMLEM_LOCUS1445 [Lemmus lemmus]
MRSMCFIMVVPEISEILCCAGRLNPNFCLCIFIIHATFGTQCGA